MTSQHPINLQFSSQTTLLYPNKSDTSGSHRQLDFCNQNIRPWSFLLFVLCWLCIWSSAYADDDTTQGVLNYTVQFRGIDNDQLQKKLESVSRLVRWQKKPPEVQIRLEQRAQSDLKQMQELLRSEGYYSSSQNYRINSNTVPLKITIDIDTGPLYKLQDYRISYQGNGPNMPGLPWRDTNYILDPDQPARAKFVIDTRNTILNSLSEIGYPNSKLLDQHVVVDHELLGMSVNLKIEPGDQAHFGKLKTEGANTVQPDYIQQFVPWHTGEMFDSRKISKFRNALLATGLFDTVAIEYPMQLEKNDRLDITLKLTERKHRSIELGMRWSTDKGFEGNIAWENRNILGRQESIAINAELGQIKQEIEAHFTKPHFLQSKQNLLANAALAHEDTPAYTGPLSRFSIGLQRPLAKSWKLYAGIPLEYSQLSDQGITRRFFLWGLEAKAERDTSNDRFDPSDGTRLKLSLTPLLGWGEQDIGFVTSEFTGTTYFDLANDQSIVLAGRIKLGSIFGSTTPDLPANKRFYAGGGDSIRGYSFQLAGPLGTANAPLGGRSVFELNTEIRAKISDSIGAVVFLDGGNVYDGELPDFFGGQLWAVGVGLRYFTAVGPLRLDFGFPLNRRDGIDDVFQFYISVGQAF